MPITMQKRRYPKQHIKAVTCSDEKEQNGWCESLVSKLVKRIPAALVLLFLVFVWSSSTTFISGSVFHVCVASRKLNIHLYCISSGPQPSNLDIPHPITKDPTTTQNNYTILGNVEAPPAVPISAVFRTPLSSLSNSAKESVALKKNVKAPSTVAVRLPSTNKGFATSPSAGGDEKKKLEDDATSKPLAPIIQMPVSNSSNAEHTSGGKRDGQRKAVEVQSPVAEHLPEEAKDPKSKTTEPIIRLPVAGSGGVKSNNLPAETTLAPGTESESPTTPAYITFSEKIEDKTKKEVPPGTSTSTKSTSTPASTTVSEKMENKTKIEEEIEIGKRDAEEQMEVLRLYNSGKPMNYSNPKACEGRGIFVYDLPAKFNKDLVGHCTSVAWLDFCKFLSNNAFGAPVPQLGDGWYNTHQYALEPIFHARVLKHPCRVHNPEEAKLFYVPYYGGLDILRWHFKKNITIQMKDELSYKLVEWLSQQAPWQKSLGLDHLFVLGKISWDFRRMKNFTWGTHFLDLDEMQSPMKLLIERHPWHINDVGVPHPSYFHPRSDDDIIAWQRKLMQMPRKNLVSFAGAPRPNARDSIRSILIEQCTSAPDKCKFFDCREARCTQPAPMVQLFTESEFCLQPAGDSPTRKSVFDSLVAGCIPVLFNPFTAYYQYPWHLPADQSNYSVFVDQDVVKRRQVNVVDRLATIPAAWRSEIRRYIVYELLPGLVYADPEAKLEKFEDAFSVAMKSVLERMSRLP